MAGGSTKSSQLRHGDPYTDGAFYPTRITILAGVLSALSLYHRLRLEKWDQESFVHDFLTAYIKRIQVWGESAAPYLTMAALELEQHGAHSTSEKLIAQFVRTIVDLNGSKGRGLPNPYYEPEDALRLLSGLDPQVPPAPANAEVLLAAAEIQPALAKAPATAVAKRIGVSRWYAGRIREGYRPHLVF